MRAYCYNCESCPLDTVPTYYGRGRQYRADINLYTRPTLEWTLSDEMVCSFSFLAQAWHLLENLNILTDYPGHGSPSASL